MKTYRILPVREKKIFSTFAESPRIGIITRIEVVLYSSGDCTNIQIIDSTNKLVFIGSLKGALKYMRALK